MKPEDLYMHAFLCECLTSRKLLWLGHRGHPGALKSLFEAEQQSSLADRVLPAPPKDSVVRDISNYEIIEKHTILELMDRRPHEPFDSADLLLTPRLIEFYADAEGATQEDLEEIHKRTLLKYREQQLQLLVRGTHRQAEAERILREW